MRTLDEIHQDLQAIRLFASVASHKVRTAPQVLAARLVELLVVLVAGDLLVSGVIVLMKTLAPKGIVVAINSIVGIVADKTEDA